MSEKKEVHKLLSIISMSGLQTIGIIFSIRENKIDILNKTKTKTHIYAYHISRQISNY